MFRFTVRSGQSLEDSLLEMLSPEADAVGAGQLRARARAVARLVSRIERKCPGIVVLATSREGLAIDGEQILALPPLEAGDQAKTSSD